MKRIFCALMALIFLSGCALSTIKPHKKTVREEPQAVEQPMVERVREIFKPKPEPVEEKEEVLPLLEEKEEIK